MFEDLEPRPARGAPLIALGREDLDDYSVEDLKTRIAGLEAEIARSRAAIDGQILPARRRRRLFQLPLLNQPLGTAVARGDLAARNRPGRDTDAPAR